MTLKPAKLTVLLQPEQHKNWTWAASTPPLHLCNCWSQTNAICPITKCWWWSSSHNKPQLKFQSHEAPKYWPSCWFCCSTAYSRPAVNLTCPFPRCYSSWNATTQHLCNQFIYLESCRFPLRLGTFKRCANLSLISFMISFVRTSNAATAFPKTFRSETLRRRGSWHLGGYAQSAEGWVIFCRKSLETIQGTCTGSGNHVTRSGIAGITYFLSWVISMVCRNSENSTTTEHNENFRLI